MKFKYIGVNLSTLLVNAFFLLSCVALTSIYNTASADTATDSIKKISPWKFKGSAGLNFAQTSLTNWSAGGESSIAGNAVVNLQLDYNKNKHKWVTFLNTEYGLTYTKSASLNKTVDKLNINSKYGYSLDKKNKWYLSVDGDFKTQYDKGYSSTDQRKLDNDTAPTYMSKFMSPGYLNLALGIEFHHKNLIDVSLSPATMRTTFVNDPFLSSQGAFGVTPGKKYLIEAGLQLNARLNWEITKMIILTSGLTLFTPYNEDFGNIVVDWDVLLVMKITPWLNATVGTTLKYDDKVKTVDASGNTRGAKVQFREMITVGVAYMFSTENKKVKP